MSDANPFVATYNEHADAEVAYSRSFTHLDEVGAPVANTGMTAVMAIRRAYNTEPAASTGDSTITCTVGGANGVVTASITEANMKACFPEAQYTVMEYVYDIVLRTAGEATFKLITGTFTVHPTASET